MAPKKGAKPKATPKIEKKKIIKGLSQLLTKSSRSNSGRKGR
ncbi:MAG: hypothetical protein ABIQ16_18085 [Polyangiaceae bacterium]